MLLLAGAPDTPEIAAEFNHAFDHLKQSRGGGVTWVQEMLPRQQVRQVMSNSTVFACPSIYEPLGIVNLEAMATETAVVASAVGGIPEVVVDGETGLLVPPTIRRRPMIRPRWPRSSPTSRPRSIS